MVFSPSFLFFSLEDGGEGAKSLAERFETVCLLYRKYQGSVIFVTYIFLLMVFRLVFRGFETDRPLR